MCRYHMLWQMGFFLCGGEEMAKDRRAYYRAYMKKLRQCPEFQEQERKRNRKRYQTPKRKASLKASNRRTETNPVYREKKRKRERERTARLGGSNKHRRLWPFLRARDGDICRWCGKVIDFSDPSSFHVDHWRPTSKGGTDDPSNLSLMHSHCNMQKKDWWDGSELVLGEGGQLPEGLPRRGMT